MKKLWMILLLSIVGSLSAFAGPISSGGGHDYGLDFQANFETSLKNIKSLSGMKLVPEFSEIAKIDFKKALPHLKIVVVSEPLETVIGQDTQESTAINFPSNQLIKINSDRWGAMDEAALKEGLALHEMLSLIGKENSGNYRYSGLYVAKFGYSNLDLEQKFQMKRKTLTYNHGTNQFAITATERWIKDRFFDSVRIDYFVTKNGQHMSSMDAAAGTMYSCVYGTPPTTKLPDDFVQVLSDGNNEFGFYIKGLGVCGNTTSLRLHVIAPSDNESLYSVREIVTKALPQTRVTARGAELWYMSQEWGKCGTSESFFVPNVFLLRTTTPLIQAVKLPVDINQIPTFANYPMENFMSLFTAGVKTNDWQLMNLANTYFDVNDIDRYSSCGLPRSEIDAQKMVEAMKQLGDSLDTFRR